MMGEVSLETYTGGWDENIAKKPYQVKMGGNFFVKRKKFPWKYKISITFTTLEMDSSIFFLDFYEDKNNKLHSFFAVPTIVETAMEAPPLLIINLCN